MREKRYLEDEKDGGWIGEMTPGLTVSAAIMLNLFQLEIEAIITFVKATGPTWRNRLSLRSCDILGESNQMYLMVFYIYSSDVSNKIICALAIA
jgi:hypothetical protein